MTHEYVAERAELYALGALDDDERRAIEAHLRECSSCSRLVGAAERDVALIASMEAHREAPPELAARIERTIRPQRSAWQLPYALAAALLVGLLPSAYFWSENRGMHATMLAQNAVMERLAGAPHRMTRFHPMQPSPPAEVVYAPDGSWYLVVVRDAGKALDVVWMHDGERTMLGRATPRGNLAMLYLPKSHRMDRLALMDGDRVVAEATLSWRRSGPNRQGARSG
ncbi:MAG: zf-HC2 domain-containing protein [Candidatus Cybelea sp.]